MGGQHNHPRTANVVESMGSYRPSASNRIVREIEEEYRVISPPTYKADFHECTC